MVFLVVTLSVLVSGIVKLFIADICIWFLIDIFVFVLICIFAVFAVILPFFFKLLFFFFFFGIFLFLCMFLCKIIVYLKSLSYFPAGVLFVDLKCVRFIKEEFSAFTLIEFHFLIFTKEFFIGEKRLTNRC